jgi:TatD DNase family protein
MTVSGLIDTHAHLMDRAFDADRTDVLARARAAGVTALVLVGYDLATSRAAVELAQKLPNACAAVGIHPNSAAEASPADYAAIAELARAPEVVAVGETGLDNYREFTPPERQRQSLEWHLRLASELALPVVIHNRQADADLAHMVQGSGVAGILHCFSSSDTEYLDLMLAEGFFVSFAGPLTFKNARATRDMARRVPLDRLLIETDCPYLAPEPHRGRRNEPAFVRDTAACLAAVLGIPLEALTPTLWRNSIQVLPALQRLEVAA